MKNLIIFIIFFTFTLSGCATRRKVIFNKTTGERWITVDNPAEFLTPEEQLFVNYKEINKKK